MVEPGVSFNWVDIPQGRFIAKVLTGRFVYMFDPRTFVSALVQYNSDDRHAWPSTRGSAGSTGRAAISSSSTAMGAARSSAGSPKLQNRAFTIKLTRFFRM